MEKQKFYITTPIYYPSDKLHIGHTYCTVATDAMARYKRLTGCDVLFLTGTDEHGQKIEDKAKAAGKTPKEFLDNIVEGPQGILDLWKLMNISNDRFIRTTDDYHCASIQKIFRKMYEKGDIYKGTYKGKYCKPCESFWTESQLVDGKCPDCGREVMDAEEEAYFFRLSKYADRVRHLLEDTDFLQPRSRVNEMVNNFIKPGLEDLCVSRTSFSWGIPVDFDPGHVVYVWVDALFNYTTALGFMNDRYHDYDKYWPADVHFVGKEIVRFHSIIWPAMLMSMDMPLPKHVYGHGWLVMDGGKMSKSKGNVVDPYVLAEKFGVDALRFFLLRTFPFGSDGNFSNELLIQTINMDLANDLGNLVSRTTAMVEKYFGGTLPTERLDTNADDDLKQMVSTLRDRYEAEMEHFQFQNALEQVFKTIQRANKYIDENAPWTLAKDPANRARLATVMYNLLETIRICAVLLTPFIPDSAEKIFDQIGACPCCRTWEKANVWGSLRPDVTVHKGEALFPRIDAEKALAELNAIQEAQRKAALPALELEPYSQENVDFDTFCKSDFRAVKIKNCEAVKKSDKLLKFTLDDGSGTDRTILSGIHHYYEPEQLIGKTAVAVLNLPPRKMMGIPSCGMLISAVHKEKGEEKLHLLLLDDSIPAGAKLC
ncbi:methionine--tRNA ligase [Oscillospiraceae bacterium CLA-AA-H272]|uniref:Methionine--tRNA ligase n=1 Tax=Brotocaccenecus cirricatena TaxID=3064195 RepID=A0AAE3DE06_9FIRM|nr:methionine--tRNA ligase [Brotocaccenecus cirricatena]MCC2129577.1 methionine--tRNA ligase [Brotocaccenecus cirricatena]